MSTDVASDGSEDITTTTTSAAQFVATAAPVVAIAMIIIILAVLIIYCICRCKAKLGGGYSKVRHNLEDEEREFQRKLEESIPTYDELFKFEDDDEMELDEKELERLTLLEDFADGLLENDADTPNKKEAKEASPSITKAGAVASEGSATKSTPQRTDSGSNRPRSEEDGTTDDDTEASQQSVSDGHDGSSQKSSVDDSDDGASTNNAASPVKEDTDVAAKADVEDDGEEQF